MKLFFIVLFIFANSALAAKSLEWQKIDLEKDIRTQYEKVISSIIERDKFFVNVEVKYTDPGMPKFQDLNEDQFKISDVKFDDSKGDYIAFSKIGLEVPVLGKSYKENQRYLKEMYRFNESYDLFKNLQSIDVKINIDENIQDLTFNNIQKVSESVRLSYVNFVPAVGFNKVNLSDGLPADTIAPKEESFSAKDLVELLGRFGNAIGMIITVLLIGFIAFKLLRMYMEFMERLRAMALPKEEKEEEDDKDQDSVGPGALPQNELPSMDEDQEVVGIDRFEKLLELNEDQALFIVKKWIAEPSAESKLALTAVAQQLNNDSLKILYSNLSTDKRNDWNSYIEGHLESNELTKANKIVSEAVIKELVAGSPIDDLELLDLILGMNSVSVKEYIVTNKEFGPLLSNLISPKLLAEVMNELDSDEVDNVIGNSIEVKHNDIVDKISNFKTDLKKFCKRFETNPFGKKISEIVSDVSIEKELILYKYLLTNGNIEDVRNAAKKCIPSNLVLKLPAKITKFLLNDYQMKKKVELIAILGDDEREEILDVIAEKGSSVREMLQMELNLVLDDELVLKRLNRRADEIKMDYINFTRSALAVNTEHTEQIEDFINEWIATLAANPQDATRSVGIA